MLANTLLDAVIILLLLTTIGYCWNLSRKLSQWREGRKELVRFVEDFNAAIARAEKNIQELRALESDADEKLCEHIRKARFLANDLAFLMNKGENVADALEHYITTSRMFNPRPSPDRRIGGAPSQRAIPDWENGVDRERAPVEKPGAPRGQMSPSKKQALNSVLAQIAARKTPSAANAGSGLLEYSEEEPAEALASKKRTLAETLKLAQIAKTS